MFAASKTASVSGGYQISRSLRFNSADSAYLNRTPASATNRKTWTWSAWVKKTQILVSGDVPNNLFGARSGNYTLLRFCYNFTIGNTIRIEDSSFSILTLPTYRDPSAWYHIVLAVDTTQATDTNRVKLYVNNVLQSFDGSYTSYPAQNYDTQVNNNIAHNIGAQPTYGDNFNGYMTEINFVDGSQLTPSSFGETNAQTGVWQPKAYSGSYGTNGFYLNFSDNSNTTAATLGKDYSGNGNNWTPNNFSVTAGAGNDSLVDSPTSYGTDTGVGGTVRGNYSTWNPLQQLSSLPSNGNLFVETNGNVGDGAIRNTLGLSSGKWYFEATVSTNYPGNWNAGVIELTGASNAIATSNGNSTSKFAFILGGGTLTWYKKTNSSLTAISPSGCADGTVMSIAVDLDSGKMWVAKNGTWADSGNPSAGTNAQFTSIPSDTYLITAFPYKDGSGNISFNANFGQRPFAYTAPSGYKALCTQNLPTPTIGATTATQASKFFAPVLYSGNGASSRAVTGVGFQPDFVWLKARNYAFVNGLWDSVRGGGKLLISNLTLAEITNDPNGYVSSFDSDGFTLTAGTTNNDTFNGSANSMVSWNWKANGSGSTNTSGSITSTVSANTTSGFSVVTFTANGTTATVGHGLGVAPKLYIVKQRNSTGGAWYVFTTIIDGSLDYLTLNTTDAAANSSYTAPTATVFEYNDDNATTQVAYCFAEVAGYSKFGSYTGNGSTDGTFVYFGFRPAYVMIKASSAVDNWVIMDVARNPANAVNYWLQAESSAAEATLTPPQFDFVSNGLKLRGTSSSCNASGTTYIYMAFASNPFKYSLAR